MEWVEQFLSRTSVADVGDSIADRLSRARMEAGSDAPAQARSWIERARTIEWGSEEAKATFEQHAVEALADLDTGSAWLKHHVEVLVDDVRRDGHRFLAGRSEPELRFLIVESLRRVPPKHHALEEAMAKEFGEDHIEVRPIVDWAIERGLIQKRSGDSRGRHLSITSEGREWLEEARNELLSTSRARRSLLMSDWTLDVSFVRDADIRSVVAAKVAELAIARAAELPMASVVLAGAISEGILYDALVARKAGAMASAKAPKFKGAPKDPESEEWGQEWALRDFIDVALDLGLLRPQTAKMAHDVLRDFRNMIHPKKQAKQDMRPEAPEMNACIAWLEALARDVSRAPAP